MGTALTPLEKKRSALLKGMTEAGQALVIELEEKIAREAAGHIMTAYAIGARVAEAAKAENEGTYGTNFVANAADYLNFPGGARSMNAMIAFSKAFPKDFVKQQSLRMTATGGTLEVSHWLHLARVEDGPAQEKLLEMVFAKSLSARELDDEIRSGTKVRLPRGPGRSPRQPNSPVAGFQQLTKLANSFSNLRETLEKSVFAQVDQASNTQVSEALLERMQIAFEAVTVTRDTADAELVWLTDGLERVRRLLEAAGEEKAAELEAAPAAGAPETNGEAPRKGKTKGKGAAGKGGKGRKTARKMATADA